VSLINIEGFTEASLSAEAGAKVTPLPEPASGAHIHAVFPAFLFMISLAAQPFPATLAKVMFKSLMESVETAFTATEDILKRPEPSPTNPLVDVTVPATVKEDIITGLPENVAEDANVTGVLNVNEEFERDKALNLSDVEIFMVDLKVVVSRATTSNLPLSVVVSAATLMNLPWSVVVSVATAVNLPASVVVSVATSLNLPWRVVVSVATAVNLPASVVVSVATLLNLP
jgi:hypothetical protein